jgi:ferritin-like metal-binding protein YciE
MTEAVSAGASRLPLDDPSEDDVALTSPRDLFLFELGGMYDAEHKAAEMLNEMAGQIQDGDLTQLIRTTEQVARQRINGLAQCFQALGAQPQRVPCPPVDGLRQDYQQVMQLNPSPEVLSLKALGTLMKASHFKIASYRGLVDKAVLMGETQCSQILQTILIQEEEIAATLERRSHDMSQRAMAPA